jgi:hypothetical protein
MFINNSNPGLLHFGLGRRNHTMIGVGPFFETGSAAHAPPCGWALSSSERLFTGYEQSSQLEETTQRLFTNEFHPRKAEKNKQLNETWGHILHQDSKTTRPTHAPRWKMRADGCMHGSNDPEAYEQQASPFRPITQRSATLSSADRFDAPTRKLTSYPGSALPLSLRTHCIHAGNSTCRVDDIYVMVSGAV